MHALRCGCAVSAYQCVKIWLKSWSACLWTGLRGNEGTHYIYSIANCIRSALLADVLLVIWIWMVHFCTNEDRTTWSFACYGLTNMIWYDFRCVAKLLRRICWLFNYFLFNATVAESLSSVFYSFNLSSIISLLDVKWIEIEFKFIQFSFKLHTS